jgi:HEPN domain-containing protein
VTRDPASEGRRWLAQAADDLETAELLVRHGRHPVACFLAQQCAEKALKGALYHAGAEVVLGHSVAALCRDLASAHPTLASRCGTWATLDQHYIPSRYPDALPGGTPADVYTDVQARAAVDLAAEVVAAVGALIDGPAP